MDLVGLIRDKWTLSNGIDLLMMGFSMIQLFECVRTFCSQKEFFKRNSTNEKIKERTNKALLGFVLKLIDTRLGKVGCDVIAGIVGAILFIILLFATPAFAQPISSAISIIAVGSWMLLSNRNNKIVRRIEESKPNIPK